MSKLRDIVFVTFDKHKDEYPSMTYSVAALIASLKAREFSCSHLSIDLQHALEEGAKETDQTIQALLVGMEQCKSVGYLPSEKMQFVLKAKTRRLTLNEMVTKKLQENIEYLRKFRFVAVSLTAWSIEHCHILLGLLSDWDGRIILGGYEVTSMKEEDLVETFPRADFFIKGFAEKTLRKLLSGENSYEKKVIEEEIEPSDLESPYLSGILPVFSRKIHWETKRGCHYTCGFCEWGKATKKVVYIDEKRLFSEIELFRKAGVEEVNILDGTFNFGPNYLKVFGKLLELPGVKITCQARFENLAGESGREFLMLCAENKDRVHLEFGLQTINNAEMDTIGRRNIIDKVRTALESLTRIGIDFGTSIIYAIPGQTVESFIDSIEFLIGQGCKKIMAYPLRIPKNSDLECRKEQLGVREAFDNYNIRTVSSSASFTTENKLDMDKIARRFEDGDLTIPGQKLSGKQIKSRAVNEYQKELTFLPPDQIRLELAWHLLDVFVIQTLKDIASEDVRDYLRELGKTARHMKDKEFFSDLISGQMVYELRPTEKPEKTEPYFERILAGVDPNRRAKKYRCRVRIGTSGNVYIYREIIVS